MVRLSKIYTKTGDAGQTGLGDGARVSKSDPRVEAYGAVDEANAAIGVAAIECDAADPLHNRIHAILIRAQNDLFDVGADLCAPISTGESSGQRLRVTPEQTKWLETAIDEHNADLKPLNSFVLPGGTRLAAALHVARTVVRRAEREVVRLIESAPKACNSETVVYLNRLSDLLFVLSRVANDHGARDVLWKPGATRGNS